MRMPSFDKFQKFMQVTAFFVCGMVVGSAVYSALENDIVDQVIQKNYQLEDQLETMRLELKLAQQARNENIISHIKVIFQQEKEKDKIDILTETTLKKRLKEDLDNFLGRSIYDINTDAVLVRKLLSTKIYNDVADKNYTVSIKTILVVDGVLQTWVEAKAQPNS